MMRTVSTEDAQLRCEHAPRPGAPALLFLNALSASLEMWDDQMALLQEQFEVVRYDVRGHGNSSIGSRAELTMEQLARDALTVLDACGIARAHLCGLSLGGMTAMHIARHWPDRVLKVALCNTAPYMPPRENWEARIKAARTQGLAELTEATLGRWFTPAFRTAEPERVERIREMLLGTDANGYAACCAAIRDMDQRESIKQINATALVIGGAHDASAPPAVAQAMTAAIPNARLVILEAAHLSNVERAGEFNATLLEFLSATL